MKTIVYWTLWQRRISTLWWSLGVFFMIFINMIFYPSFKNDAAELQKSFENLPDAAVQLIGGSTDFFSSVGFLNSQIFFLTLPLMIGILAINLGSSLVGREEQSKTLEILLARPISRTRLLSAKALAGAIIVGIVSISALLTTVITGTLVEIEVGVSQICMAVLACYIMCLCFGTVALLTNAYGRTKNASLAIAAAVALGGYIVSSLAGTVSWLQKPSLVFPFHYYSPDAVLRSNPNYSDMLVLLTATGVMLVLSVYSFRHRDLD